MEMKPGYKQTEVGPIPADWNVTPLYQCLSQPPRYGINAAAVPFDDTLPTYIRITDISEDGRFVPAPKVSVAHREATEYLLNDGDLVFARTGASVGKSYCYDPSDGALVFAGFLIQITPDINRLRPRLLKQYVQTAAYWNWVATMSTRSGQPGINGQEYGTLLLPLPPTTEEQDAIATALSDVDALLEGLDRLIAKKRDLKQAAMQQLLTGKTRFPGFDGEWEVKRIDQIADIRSGGTPSTTQPRFWDGGIPWCTPTDITALGGRKYLSETTRTISAAGLRSSSAETVPAHSIIMTSRATIGECAINTVPMTTNQGFKNLIPQNDVDTEFLYYLMTTQTDRLVQLCGGSTFLEIGKKQLSSFEVMLPCDPDEQTAIAQVLSDMDAEIEALEKRRAKTRDLKQALMQELLTGKTRLVPLSNKEDASA